ncbi:hypothetical protein [Nocardia albiluteola]|uniref:hypothetical protein n=1 Tax=Nocardia albiluteola TaxID=2842303 RepID=UPI002478EB22|nr:hypothetical protein [Nocardia albiluteola]
MTGPVGIGTDTSAWPTLGQTAKKGDLTFNSTVAQDCVNACQTLLATIESTMNTIAGRPNPSPNLPLITTTAATDDPSSEVGSAHRFRNHLITKWTDLYNTLYEHTLILNDMADTFVTAGNNYAAAEHASTVTFTNPHSTATGPNTPTTSDITPSESDWSAPTPTTGITPDTQAAAIAAGAEDGTSWHRADFYYIGHSISENRHALSDATKQWSSLKTTWVDATDTFSTKIRNALKSENWTGPGATAALTAIDNYYNGAVNQLSLNIEAMTNTLTKLIDLLAKIPYYMPNDPDGYDYGHCHRSVSYFQDHWHDNYVVGLPQIAKLTPTFTDPGTATGPNANGSSGSSSGPNATGPTSSSGPNGNSSGPGNNNGHETGTSAGTISGPSEHSYSYPKLNTDGLGGGPGSSGGLGGGGLGGLDTGGGLGGLGSGGLDTGGRLGGDTGGVGGLGSPSGSSYSPNRQPESAPTSPLTGVSGPLSALGSLLQNALGSSGALGLGNLLGASGASGPYGASGPFGASGVSGPFGLDGTSGAGLNASGPGLLSDLAGLGGGGGAGGALGPSDAGLGDTKLFPRASAPDDSAKSLQAQIDELAAGRAGIAAGAQESSAMPMMPMGGMGGMGAGGAQSQQKERKRAAYLDAKEHLDEALGEDPLSVRSIIDR